MANKVSEMFEGLTNNFKGMIDANSVVGEPIIVNDGFPEGATNIVCEMGDAQTFT